MTRLIIYFLLLQSNLMYCQAEAILMSALDEKINTADHEELGRWNVDGKSLIFTRLTAGRKNLFLASFDVKNELIQVEEFKFDSSYNGGGHTISPDGKHLVFTLCNRSEGFGGCDLYQSFLRNGKWTTASNMGGKINGGSWEGQPAFGMEGLTIYFASARPGGFGGSDIWFIRELSPGVWSKPLNAGKVINTSDNEGSPFIHFDGRTLYFMRDGEGGYGGYDLYFSQLGIDDNWGLSKNMGKSINTKADEGGLAIHPNGHTAMITKSTPSKRNELFEFELPENFRSSSVQAFYVNVIDLESNKPIKAHIELFGLNGTDTIRTSKLSDEKGNITMTLDRNKPYGMILSATGYMIHSVNLPASPDASRNLVVKMMQMNSSESKQVALQNIFFDTGSYALLPASIPELKILAKTMKMNPGMMLEIQGHTDDIGPEEDNQILSTKRAESVFNFLVDHGIDQDRLSFKGLGESQPIFSNETPSGREKNRRTEFLIMKI